MLFRPLALGLGLAVSFAFDRGGLALARLAGESYGILSALAFRYVAFAADIFDDDSAISVLVVLVVSGVTPGKGGKGRGEGGRDSVCAWP